MKLIDLGLNTYTPTLDTGCDFIVEGGDGRLIKVQVKSTRDKVPNNRFRVSTSIGNCKAAITTKDVDIVAVHIQSTDVWYFIPSEMITSISTYIYPHKEDCRFTPYLEKWEIFK